ncbi:MAG: haloacid dehalogenase-like hydrolase [Actinomycetota bacterium]|nr:haloacid dehalogenase-like hydrolase [Actinomycetota bacterium]
MQLPVLLLFDIDGTLLSGATDAHREALLSALFTVHGVRARSFTRPVSPAGRTDAELARTVLLDAGVSAERIDARAKAVCEECCRVYARLCPKDLSGTVLPGVPLVLEWLSGQQHLMLALLTGNFEPVARLKLARAGIGRYFPRGQGAFGSDSEDRAALPAIARRRAGTPGHPHPRSRTIVIGDTPRDIACARADGVRVIAVACGPFTAGELSDADAVVEEPSALRDPLVALGV